MIQTRPQRPSPPAVIYKTPSGHDPIFLGRPSEPRPQSHLPPLPTVRPIAAATRRLAVAPPPKHKSQLWFGMLLGAILVLLILAVCYFLGLGQMLPI